MDKKSKFILLGVVVLIGIGIFIYSQKSVLELELEEEVVEPTEEIVLPPDKKTEAIEEIKKEIMPEQVAKLASCLIFEKEEYCQKGEVYEFTDEVKAYDREKDDLVFIREETFRDLIFSLPAGVKVYSPMTGFARGYEIRTDPQKGISMNIVQLFIPPEEDGRDFLFSGLKLDPFLAGEYQKTGEGVEVKAGQLLGVIDGKTLENLDTSLKDNFTFRIDVDKVNYKIIDEAIAEGDSKKAVEAMRSDNTTLGIFFPYYLK